MATIANKATARSYFEQVVNQGDMAVADAIFASEIQFHYPLGNLSGAGAVKDYLAAVRMAFPDIHFSVADLVAEGDRVAARWTLAGSHDAACSWRSCGVVDWYALGYRSGFPAQLPHEDVVQ